MVASLQAFKSIIDQHTTHVFADTFSTLPRINRWHPDALARLKDITLKGKSIRGSLILLVEKLLTGEMSKSAKDVAVAMEVFQTSILAHDDFIDHDDKRRGTHSLPSQYKELAGKESLEPAEHVGNSLAICAGDIGFFLSYFLLNEVETSPDIRQKIIRAVSGEYALIGMAEMEDIAFAANDAMPSADAVISMYTYKTARYTFSLPFMIGAILSHKDDAFVSQLSQLGEDIGVLFQIHDDELSLTGSQSKTGKVVGNDIRENKKTLHRILLEELSNPSQKETLHKLFGNPALALLDMSLVQQLLKDTGAYDRIEKVKSIYKVKIDTALQGIDNEPLQFALKELSEYVISREA
jgi:geranylgeranyl diphosphate synthase type I